MSAGATTVVGPSQTERASGPWYVFGFVERPVDVLPAGPLGEPRTVPLDGLDGWAIVAPSSDRAWDEAEPEILAAAAVHHDEVLRSCVGANVVPARFGGTVATIDDVRTLGSLQGADLRAAFDLIGSRHQYDVRLAVSRAKIRAGSGRDYLIRRHAQLAGSDELGAAIVAITEMAPDTIVKSCAADAARLAVLAGDDVAGRIEAVVDDGVTVTISGPLPPYDFVRSMREESDPDVDT